MGSLEWGKDIHQTIKDKLYDRVTPKSEKHIEHFKNRNFFKVTTMDDLVIRCIISEDKAIVYDTNTILTTLMSDPHPVDS